MKATGVIRRIDDLGRFVIPKELRRAYHLSEGDPLEIYTSDYGEIILKKYSAFAGLDETATNLADILSKRVECPVLIADSDCVIASCRAADNKLLNSRLSEAVREMVAQQKTYIPKAGEAIPVTAAKGTQAFAVVPISAADEVYGAVILLRPHENKKLGALEIALAQFAAEILTSLLGS